MSKIFLIGAFIIMENVINWAETLQKEKVHHFYVKITGDNVFKLKGKVYEIG